MPELNRFKIFFFCFQGSGFDRGHLAPAGNHKASQELCNETFLLSNMAPQVSLNFKHSYENLSRKFVCITTKSKDGLLDFRDDCFSFNKKLPFGSGDSKYYFNGDTASKA